VRTVNLGKEKVDLECVISLARGEPVLLVTSDGEEFCIAEADDFESEVKSLRESQAFQKFLDERSACSRRTPLAEIEQQIQRELAEGQKTT
jgi:hypothetical protein